ncbi:hypothetical protein MIN45_P0230 [Methylomarinovum tepidoasis]|uniref:histidine kinase n=1 Tax=Methylomarinovum tepidoasis TaxID=2840183 RepID=A0AAU9CCA5_9GAMM|nr:XrtA/PEP-CTERM system histidine kinase PrsK [Methylomarinovum sp. IN45]BCX87863.1 hypothetical protein MIN45_P0230 [Methylomarinovum sp. IN45]
MNGWVGAISYGIGAAAYLVLGLTLAAGWRGRRRGGLLLLAIAGTALWAAVNAWQLAYHSVPLVWLWSLETAHLLLWLAFLWQILPDGGRLRRWRFASYALGGALLAYHWSAPWVDGFLGAWQVTEWPLMGQLLLALTGLVLLEQLYRNLHPERRWAVKFLCLALGTLFAYEFYLYADALLFKRINAELWQARGLISALLVPLLAVSAVRNPDWSIDAFVSRDVVFHSTALFGAGLYLLTMAAAGYYVRLYGGEWGRVLQAVFLVAALVLLAVLLFSGQLRARLRIFLNKHFFNYRYDYRKEWLRITAALSQGDDGMPLGERVIRALAELVESPGGTLWVRSDSGHYLQRADRGGSGVEIPWIEADDPVIAFMKRREWVVDLDELQRFPELYEGLSRPPWLADCRDAWLLVPLFHGHELWGVVLLLRPLIPLDCNWEVIDVLKTAGRQAAGFLALEETAARLLEARQFEGFNRLSAFVVHDLKNLIAQLSLVVRNAERHAGNPEFVRDAMTTVEHAVGKMSRLLEQLKSMGKAERAKRIALRPLLEEVVSARAGQLPRPRFVCEARGDLWVEGDADRLASAFEHVIQNAQEAAGKHGWVRVRLARQERQAIIEVEDNGPGMDAAFIRQRLFKPFETTKGLTGMGIGAYESREYTRQLGGDLVVRSTPGEGTCFRFVLPLAVSANRIDSDKKVPT